MRMAKCDVDMARTNDEFRFCKRANSVPFGQIWCRPKIWEIFRLKLYKNITTVDGAKSVWYDHQMATSVYKFVVDLPFFLLALPSVHCGRKFSVSLGWRRWSKSRFSAPQNIQNSLTQSLSLYRVGKKKTFLSPQPFVANNNKHKVLFRFCFMQPKKGN
jgi:hypothetical protein